MVQLRAEHALGQLLLELLDKPRFSKHALGVTASHLRRQKEKGPARILFHYFAIAGLNLLVALVAAVIIVRPKRVVVIKTGCCDYPNDARLYHYRARRDYHRARLYHHRARRDYHRARRDHHHPRRDHPLLHLLHRW